MSEIKACPFCGGAKICTEKGININYCDNCSAESNIEQWNTRPIEDALNARIAELEAENNRLAELLHNELSSVEIATDLGNKRWVALNDIYENGEKHNANWCKRKAQEGLGIK
jgi:NMD protein affecting ribosome stability and mRNA decay